MKEVKHPRHYRTLLLEDKSIVLSKVLKLKQKDVRNSKILVDDRIGENDTIFQECQILEGKCYLKKRMFEEKDVLKVMPIELPKRSHLPFLSVPVLETEELKGKRGSFHIQLLSPFALYQKALKVKRQRMQLNVRIQQAHQENCKELRRTYF